MLKSSFLSTYTDSLGFLYVNRSDGNVIKLRPDGSIQTILNTRASYPNEITLDRQGNIWIAETATRRIRKFDSSGKDEGQLSVYGNMAIDKQGNVWVTDGGNSRIQIFDTNGKFLRTIGPLIVDNKPSDAFGNIVIDQDGNMWLAMDDRIAKFDANGTLLLTVGSSGKEDGQFRSIYHLFIDPEGKLWVADSGNNRVQQFDASGKFLQKFELPAPADGENSHIFSINVDRNGNRWIVNGKSLQKFDNKGVLLFRMGAEGTLAGQFKAPKGIAIDDEGNVWVADRDNNRIQKFDAKGNFLLTVGSAGSGIGQFKNPRGLETDKAGNIWVADTDNYRVQVFDPYGKFLFKLDSTAYSSKSDITKDRNGIMYVGSGSAELKKYDIHGNLLQTLLLPGPGENGSGYPDIHSIAVDKDENIWVLSSSTYPGIYKYDRNGKLLFKVGTFGTGIGEFRYPEGMALDQNGNVWVTDTYAARIQKFDSIGKFLEIMNFPNIECQYITFDRSGDFYLSSLYGVLVYSSKPEKSFIKGRVYADENQNCTFDGSDKPLAGISVVAQPGNYYGLSDGNGYYQIVADSGTYTISQAVTKTGNWLVEPICPVTNVSAPVSLASKEDSITHIDFANRAFKVPHLVTYVSSDRRRRCMTNTTVVSYANTGNADATHVKVYIKLPPYVVVKSADRPYTIDKDSNYVFTIDSLKVGQVGKIHTIDSVVCVTKITGLTQCTKTWITPANAYTLPEGTQWDHSDIVLTGKCIENGRVQLVIKNVGQAMADSAEFRIMLDAQLAFRKNYKLAAGDSLVLKVPANGKTVRLEADQRPDHPRKSQTNLTIEGCVASTSDIVSKGFVDVLPQDDAEPEVAIQCMRIVDSYDPNDKLVSPAGTPVDHYTPTNSELKYTIRFQNTGTDYAYKVVVVDTLSENLDIATLQMGAASHTYSLKVSGKGQPILTWTFNNINLPDSTRDQKGSNGFIQFSIKPKTNLPEKMLIENYADIFFDYNDPVRTNTTTNVMYDVPKIINPANQLSDSIIDKVMAAEPDALKGKLSLYPNPTQSQVWIQSVDASVRIEQVKIYNLLGEAQNVSLSSVDSQAVQINMQAKPKGMYLVHIQTNKGTSIQRVVVQ
ncbi:SMP-30/gluconolactonase/LRE family protein [Cytophagaceae bacterium YF14B1]|uniref:SMP-30/gluconolactonase/LRE family protein n=1 Tax=Xanthocytophaga flava TaxID=3048013 RepID=A0AAE3UCY5_9BACT|nr:SMP-30/gluconolactonase/LRE family protein [Xanthocytophaga flavus]MDJ1485988.1 SMP-30/gluconolactonase/LRE family protein [Xanthocytophaga flavus]